MTRVTVAETRHDFDGIKNGDFQSVPHGDTAAMPLLLSLCRAGARASAVPGGSLWAGGGGGLRKGAQLPPMGRGERVSFPASSASTQAPCLAHVLRRSDHDGILRYIVSQKVQET